jgi:uncharacterized protein (TIGR03083 family)
MPLTDLLPVDTRPFFRPVTNGLATLLRTLATDDWHRPTIAGAWRVRDVVAHLIDVSLRRVSFHRDAMLPPPPPQPIGSERDFARFINGLNAQWVAAAARFSPRVLTELFELAGRDLADWFESVPFDAPALFPVSWAGEHQSAGWFDIGREFTELWHHQQQIRSAVGEPPLAGPRYLHAVIDIAVRGLPHAYRAVEAEPGATVTIDIEGPSGGRWTLARTVERWTLAGGEPETPSVRVSLSDDSAWKLLFNALKDDDAAAAVVIEGRRDLAAPLLAARSVIV